jgi:hypothetical protein
MHPLTAWSVPCFDSIEVVEFGHTAARGSQMALRPPFPNIDPAHIEHITENAPVLVKFTRLDPDSHAGKALGIVDLIAVESKNPGMCSGIFLNEVMANRGCHDTMDFKFFTEFGFQLLQNF